MIRSTVELLRSSCCNAPPATQISLSDPLPTVQRARQRKHAKVLHRTGGAPQRTEVTPVPPETSGRREHEHSSAMSKAWDATTLMRTYRTVLTPPSSTMKTSTRTDSHGRTTMPAKNWKPVQALRTTATTRSKFFTQFFTQLYSIFHPTKLQS